MRRHQGLALHAARLIVPNTADAEDAVQNAFYKAYVALRQTRPVAVRPWLPTIVAHEARNLRLAEQRRVARHGAVAETWSNATAPDPEVAVLAHEQRTVLLEALDRLSENDRLAIAYRVF